MKQFHIELLSSVWEFNLISQRNCDACLVSLFLTLVNF